MTQDTAENLKEGTVTALNDAMIVEATGRIDGVLNDIKNRSTDPKLKAAIDRLQLSGMSQEAGRMTEGASTFYHLYSTRGSAQIVKGLAELFREFEEIRLASTQPIRNPEARWKEFEQEAEACLYESLGVKAPNPIKRLGYSTQAYKNDVCELVSGVLRTEHMDVKTAQPSRIV